MATLGPVLICKAHSDAYATALTESGFIPYFIPVLDTTLVNQEIVISTLLGGSRNNYSGVIITSSRAAEAWQIAVNELVANGNGNTEVHWNQLPFYVVGKATAQALKAIQSSQYSPVNIYGADETGTGEALARFIVSAREEFTTENDSLPLLYLTGDKNRDTIPDILDAATLTYSKLQVYETTESKEFKQQLYNALEIIGHDHIWVVLFSPSTADFLLNTVHLETTSESPAMYRIKRAGQQLGYITVRLASIGPTTTKHLTTLGYQVSASSPKPSAESLVDVLRLSSD